MAEKKSAPEKPKPAPRHSRETHSHVFVPPHYSTEQTIHVPPGMTDHIIHVHRDKSPKRG